MSVGLAQMDAPLRQAIACFGSVTAFFRAVGAPGRPDWRRVPQSRVFDVARLTGIAPQVLRPDLAAWIAEEALRRERAAAAGVDSLQALGRAVEHRWDGPDIEEGLVDLWASLASVHFVARKRGLKAQQVYAGRTAGEEAARAYAMALAKVVGRARSTHIANVFQCSRQNVDNAAERYLRARDGDDPEDFIRRQFPDGAPRVYEPGSNRLRRAKAATAGLWEDQVAFERFLTGEDMAPALPERRRA